nr:hypothetical protein [Bacillus velezensis]
MQSPLMLLQLKLADYQKKAAELRTIDEFIILKQTLQDMMKVFAACEEWELYQKTADLMAQTVLAHPFHRIRKALARAKAFLKRTVLLQCFFADHK